MKKLASMAIAGLAVTAFAACGDDDGDNNDTPDVTTELPSGTVDTGGLPTDTGLTDDTGMGDTGDTGGDMAPVTTAAG